MLWLSAWFQVPIWEDEDEVVNKPSLLEQYNYLLRVFLLPCRTHFFRVVTWFLSFWSVFPQNHELSWTWRALSWVLIEWVRQSLTKFREYDSNDNSLVLEKKSYLGDGWEFDPQNWTGVGFLVELNRCYFFLWSMKYKYHICEMSHEVFCKISGNIDLLFIFQEFV